MFLNESSADANKIDACFMCLHGIGSDTSAVKRPHQHAMNVKTPPKKETDDFLQMIQKSKSNEQMENAAIFYLRSGTSE